MKNCNRSLPDDGLRHIWQAFAEIAIITFIIKHHLSRLRAQSALFANQISELFDGISDLTIGWERLTTCSEALRNSSQWFCLEVTIQLMPPNLLRVSSSQNCLSWIVPSKYFCHYRKLNWQFFRSLPLAVCCARHANSATVWLAMWLPVVQIFEVL